MGCGFEELKNKGCCQGMFFRITGVKYNQLKVMWIGQADFYEEIELSIIFCCSNRSE